MQKNNFNQMFISILYHRLYYTMTLAAVFKK